MVEFVELAMIVANFVRRGSRPFDVERARIYRWPLTGPEYECLYEVQEHPSCTAFAHVAYAAIRSSLIIWRQIEYGGAATASRYA